MDPHLYLYDILPHPSPSLSGRVFPDFLDLFQREASGRSQRHRVARWLDKLSLTTGSESRATGTVEFYLPKMEKNTQPSRYLPSI